MRGHEKKRVRAIPLARRTLLPESCSYQRLQLQRELQVLAVAEDGEGVFGAVLAEEGAKVAEGIIGGGISIDFFEHVADGDAGEFGRRFLDDARDSEGAEVGRSGNEDEAAHVRDEEVVEVGIWLEDDRLIGIVENDGEAV